MPKTIIKRKTWGCNACSWNTDEAALENQNCPRCRKFQGIKRETDLNRMGTITIIGDEDIEDEINPDHPNPLLYNMPVNTLEEKEAYRIRRRQDIVQAKKRAKLVIEQLLQGSLD